MRLGRSFLVHVGVMAGVLVHFIRSEEIFRSVFFGSFLGDVSVVEFAGFVHDFFKNGVQVPVMAVEHSDGGESFLGDIVLFANIGNGAGVSAQ